jgi:hypothetical protein
MCQYVPAGQSVVATCLPREYIVDGVWLFVLGAESIWIQRGDNDKLELVMHGPLTHRSRYAFAGDLEMRGFLMDVEERLTRAGWTLHRFAAGQDGRRGVDRGPKSGALERRQAS